MKRRWILLVVGLVLAAFLLGTLVGSRRRSSPSLNGPTTSLEARRVPAAATSCVEIGDVGSQVGKSGCVTGQVVRVFTSRAGNTFLDFCPDFRTCPFTSVIFASDKNKFGDLDSLEGKPVQIWGDITVYEGRAEIIIHDPQQIRSAR